MIAFIKRSVGLSIFIAIGCIGVFTAAYGQKQNNQWRVGPTGVNFNTTPPTATSGAALLISEGCASIADATTGQLLFYTDGVTVWDSTNTPMPNGQGLLGGVRLLSSTTAAVLVPKPFSPQLYYVITIDEQSSANGIRYSLLDMRLNGGKGDIVTGQKNIPIYNTQSEKLEVVPTRDGCGYWLLSHSSNGNDFYAFAITQAAINTTPIISTVGLQVFNGAGHMKINPQFTKLAMGEFSTQKIELFNFNNATGVVSEPVTWAFRYPLVGVIYGVEFSPDGSKVYVADLNVIIQYDISSGIAATIEASGVDLTAGVRPFRGATLQLGPDGKVYAAAGVFARINKPNVKGTGCDFEPNPTDFAREVSTAYGLPKFIYGLQLPVNVFAYTDTCATRPTRFLLADSAAAESITWAFGDPASGAANTATGGAPKHTYNTLGSYTVTALLKFACYTDTVRRQITVNDCFPIKTIKVGTDTCVGLTHIFQAAGITSSPLFFWSFGDPASGTADTVTIRGGNTVPFPTHTFTAPGRYQVCVRLQEPGGPLYRVCQVFTINQCCVNTLFVKDSCAGAPVAFSVLSNVQAGSYAWNFGDAGSPTNTSTQPAPTHTYAQPGTYTITLSAEGPCGLFTVFLSKTIVACAPPCIPIIALLDTCLQRGSVFSIAAPSVVTGVTWNFGDAGSGGQNSSTELAPTHFFTDTGTYTVQAFVNLACGLQQATRAVRIVACAACLATVPNLVLQRGARPNRQFLAQLACPAKTFSLEIYNRWGQSVFKTNNPLEAWQPTNTGTGIYFYTLRISFTNGQSESKKGWLEYLE